MAGRKKGSKNIRRSGEALINQHGVAFTDEEKRALESLVNSANRKRKRMLREEDEMPFFVAGKETGFTRGQLRDRSFMGKENDFVLAKKTKSLQRFKSKSEYHNYVEQLQKVTDRNYINMKIGLYKKNQIDGLYKVFGKDAKELADGILNMDDKTYYHAISSDETLTISYIDTDLNEEDFRLLYGYDREQQFGRIKDALTQAKKRARQPKKSKKRGK